MKTYELSYIISPSLKSDEASGLSSEITALIQKEGGLIMKETTPNPRTLSYQIKKQGAGFQVNLEFSLEPEKLRAIEERIKKEEKILRHMLVAKRAPRREKIRKERPALKTAETAASPAGTTETPSEEEKTKEKGKKVELKDIEEKLEEILKEQ
jgi:ribosomal protein S6